jgi:hypothetical protein
MGSTQTNPLVHATLDRSFGYYISIPDRDAIRLTCVRLENHLTRFRVNVLGESCELLSDSCEVRKLSRRDSDEPFEVKAELALVREADA